MASTTTVRYWKKIGDGLWEPHSTSVKDRQRTIDYKNTHLGYTEAWCPACRAVVDAVPVIAEYESSTWSCPWCHYTVEKPHVVGRETHASLEIMEAA